MDICTIYEAPTLNNETFYYDLVTNTPCFYCVDDDFVTREYKLIHNTDDPMTSDAISPIR